MVATASGAVDRPAVRRRLRPIIQAVIAQHLGDAQPVAGKDATATQALRLAVLLRVAPRFYRLLVAPEGERQHPPGIREALEALDRDEAVDGLEQRLELRRLAEIGVAPALG